MYVVHIQRNPSFKLLVMKSKINSFFKGKKKKKKKKKKK